MVLEVFFNHIILHRKTNLIIEFGKIVVVAGIDRNMWFIVFILLWYCMLYLTFKLGVSTINKLFILSFISLIIITTPQLGVAWKINAFSFPLGCLLGLNSNFLKKLESINSYRAEILCIIICSLFLFAQSIYTIANKSLYNPYFGATAALILGIVSILILIYILRNTIHLENLIETTCISFVAIIVAFNYLRAIFTPKIVANSFFSIYAILSAITIIIFISLLIQFSLYSHFLNFIGKISFELYLLHGMFMYSFDFILFRGNIAITFFIYFLFICLASLILNKISSFVADSLLEKSKE